MKKSTERKINIDVNLAALLDGYDMAGAVDKILIRENEGFVAHDLDYRIITTHNSGNTVTIEADFLAVCEDYDEDESGDAVTHADAVNLLALLQDGMEQRGDWRVALEHAEDIAVRLVSALEPQDAVDSDKYGWCGWESEDEDTDGPSRPGVHYLTIHNPGGDEYAVIIHRVTDNPLSALDGPWASEKMQNAQKIVDALNATL